MVDYETFSEAPRCFMWVKLTLYSPGMLSYECSKLFEGLSERYADQRLNNPYLFIFTWLYFNNLKAPTCPALRTLDAEFFEHPDESIPE